MTAADQMIAEHLRKRNKRSFLIANKVDTIDPDLAAPSSARWAWAMRCRSPPPTVAASTICCRKPLGIFPRTTRRKRARGPASEEVAEGEEPTRIPGPSEKDGIKIAIIGRPNVGKSTLVNPCSAKRRVIVYDQAGTTRDSIYIPFERNEEKYT